ncbi:protein O-mannosyl-transferase Tmtc3-like [Eriocheir sinensis]|uniref:protein O-mannosyl-transferase Tmtc3-like n=1 Tax=Eriocheir sinensis TaxID=95602 RepID=UPI0021C6BF03|nr:protein O-mannosyl-transferase Tmtc3-like [Eriocheir sinensis]
MLPSKSCGSGTALWLLPRVARSHVEGVSGCLTSCHCSPRRRSKPVPLSSSSSCYREEGGGKGKDLPPTWVYLTVWLAGVLVYVNGLTGDFVHDDVSAIKTNPDVLGTNPVSHVFFNDYWGKAMSDPLSHKSYRPLTILSFRSVNNTVIITTRYLTSTLLFSLLYLCKV